MFIPIKMTERARDMVRNIMGKKGIPADYCLRIGVRGGAGCFGVNYLLGFDKEKEGDQRFDIDGIPVLIEKKHTMFIMGMTVDWVTRDGNQGFTFEKEEKEEA